MDLQNNRLLGIHHVTAITGEAQSNVNFYTGVLGLRLAGVRRRITDPLAKQATDAGRAGLCRNGSNVFSFDLLP
jgi:catechol 2,3-dioxygenase-like lactoylglutathione lyase family enzyme